tara:strand:- start:16191 stop:16670 length:480 start_codon:yes stop_codon:yes gene_type:complete
MFNNKKLQRMALLFQPNVVGYASSFLTSCIAVEGYSEMYSRVMERTVLAPPSCLFLPIWILLYTLMGIAAIRVFSLSESTNKRKGMIWNQIQLFFNFSWSIVYFGLKMVILSFANIVLLWLSIATTMYFYRKIDRVAFYLLLPYILWVSFASYLNFLAI